MPCETSRETLIEAAASRLTPQGELRAHVEACDSCRTLFAEEQALFAAIDSGLQDAANAEVPLSLLPRVRAQLNEQTVPRRSWIPAWATWAAAAALILIVVSLGNRHGKAPEKSLENTEVAKTLSAAKAPGIRSDLPAPPRPSRSTNRPIQSRGVERTSSDPQVSVLIPAGQKEVVDAFLAGLRRGVLKPEGLLAKNPEQPLQELQVSPLDISPIEVKPLADVSEDASPESETARP